MTSAKARRINARLPPEVARKVAYLEKRTNKSTTEVVVESIEHYYAAMSEDGGTTAQTLAQAGFIGCAAGPADLSSSYKNQLAPSIGTKT
jgi:predicted DNA-binding protein